MSLLLPYILLICKKMLNTYHNDVSKVFTQSRPSEMSHLAPIIVFFNFHLGLYLYFSSNYISDTKFGKTLRFLKNKRKEMKGFVTYAKDLAQRKPLNIGKYRLLQMPTNDQNRFVMQNVQKCRYFCKFESQQNFFLFNLSF